MQKQHIYQETDAKRFALLCAFVVLLAWLAQGCAVGQNYKRPVINSPANFRNAPTVSTNSLADLQWWEVYQDETLSGLIRTALTNHHDLRIAITRVEQARAVAKQAKAQFLPQAGYEGDVSRGRNEFLGGPNPAGPTGARTGDAVFAALSASWEIDLWGRIRRLNESARSQFLATEEARRGVRLSLVAEVAQAYFELLELDRRLQIVNRSTESFKESERIFNQRFEAGGASKLDTSRAEAARASTAANVPDIERQIALKENQLSVLLGQNPGPIVHTAKLEEQVMPPDVPAGLPSGLLERRPDIRQAEQNLRSANAQVGVSVAEFFPRIGITTFMGKVSPELSAFTAGTANAWSALGTISGPLFQGGALVGQYREAKANHEEARLRYEQTALNAFREVADSLVTREKLEAIRLEQERAVKAYEQAVQLSMQRYTDGKAAYFEVLEAQQQLFPAENSLARTNLNRLLVIVQLYKALGGGWESDTSGKERADARFTK
jgi:outer membrane protein, multidrug efflux system